MQENKSSRHNSVTAAVSNGQTTSQALTEVENKSKQGPSPLHHTFLLGRARFTAQPLSALVDGDARSARLFSLPSREVLVNGLEPNIFIWIVSSSFIFFDISLKCRLATVFLIGIAHREPE